MSILFITRYGQRLDLEKLLVEQVDIQEIANGIANQGRYNGQTKEFYSVAEHCVHLARYAQAHGYPKYVQRLLLLHDGTEAYVGDIVYHLKGHLPFFKELEDKIMDAIWKKFKLTDVCMHNIHPLDRAICVDEMTQLLDYPDPTLDTTLQPLGIKIKCWTPKKARKEYLKEARRLGLYDRDNHATGWKYQYQRFLDWCGPAKNN